MRRREFWEVEKLSEPGFMGFVGFSGLGSCLNCDFCDLGITKIERGWGSGHYQFAAQKRRESEFPSTKLEGVGNRSSLLQKRKSRESEFCPTKLGIGVRNPSHKRVPYKSEGVGNWGSLLPEEGNLKL